MNIKPVGEVRNAVVEATDEGWGSAVSEIRVLPEFEGGLQGLDTFSHAVIVFVMHKAAFDASRHLVRRPRERRDMPRLGIFAQRARHRPSRIGVTTVKIEEVLACSLRVRGLDAVNGSPVLDIKPHMPAFDAPPSPDQPDWVGSLMAGYFAP